MKKKLYKNVNTLNMIIEKDLRCYEISDIDKPELTAYAEELNEMYSFYFDYMHDDNDEQVTLCKNDDGSIDDIINHYINSGTNEYVVELEELTDILIREFLIA